MASAILILASRSARRASLLNEGGFDFEQMEPPFADPPQPGPAPRAQAAAIASELAFQKALSLLSELADRRRAGPVVVLGADTICLGADGALIGQPADADAARAMVRAFAACSHRVVTGVALLGDGGPPRRFADSAGVTFGALAPEEIDRYVASGGWRGKAGGYNLYERQAEGWPITVEGDPTTVVGLPMRLLAPALRRRLGAAGQGWVSR